MSAPSSRYLRTRTDGRERGVGRVHQPPPSTPQFRSPPTCTSRRDHPARAAEWSVASLIAGARPSPGRSCCKSGRGSIASPPVTPAYTTQRLIATHSGWVTPLAPDCGGTHLTREVLHLSQQTRLRPRPPRYLPNRPSCIWISGGKTNRSHRVTQRESWPPYVLLCQPAHRTYPDEQPTCVLKQDTALSIFQGRGT